MGKNVARPSGRATYMQKKNHRQRQRIFQA